MQNRHKNAHHTHGRAHIAWFESLDTKATIPGKKKEHLVEMCITFLFLEKKKKRTTLGDGPGLRPCVYYTSHYFSISKFPNDKTQPISIKLVSLMLFKCKRHPSGLEDNDAMKWKSKF